MRVAIALLVVVLFAGCPNNDDVPPPHIANIAPATAAPGTVVTITGGYFCQLPAVTSEDDPPPECGLVGTVDFDATPGTIAMWSDATIAVEVPPAIGAVSITVTVRGRRSNAFAFAIEP